MASLLINIVNSPADSNGQTIGTQTDDSSFRFTLPLMAIAGNVNPQLREKVSGLVECIYKRVEETVPFTWIVYRGFFIHSVDLFEWLDFGYYVDLLSTAMLSGVALCGRGFFIVPLVPLIADIACRIFWGQEKGQEIKNKYLEKLGRLRESWQKNGPVSYAFYNGFMPDKDTDSALLMHRVNFYVRTFFQYVQMAVMLLGSWFVLVPILPFLIDGGKYLADRVQDCWETNEVSEKIDDFVSAVGSFFSFHNMPKAAT